MSGAAWDIDDDENAPVFSVSVSFNRMIDISAHILGDQAKKLDPNSSSHVW